MKFIIDKLEHLALGQEQVALGQEHLALGQKEMALKQEQLALGQQEIRANLSLLSAPAGLISPSLSPANIASDTNEILRRTNELHVFKSLDPDAAAVLTPAQHAELRGLCSEGDEAVLVAYLTSFLIPLVHTGGRVLVNSERYAWLRRGARSLAKFDKKPDLFVAPHYCVELKEPTDTNNSALVSLRTRLACPFLFGRPLSMVWYDSINVLAAKKKLTLEAEGELMIYLQWITEPLAAPAPPCFNQLSRGMVFSVDEFALLKCQRGQITWKTSALWTQPGSAGLIRDFFSDAESAWPFSIRFLCHQFGVTPLRFLGSGATGRTLLVEMRAQPGKFKVMKVVCGQAGVLLLEHEHRFVGGLSAAQRSLSCFPRGSYFDRLIEHSVDPLAAACLMDEFGEAIEQSTTDQQRTPPLLTNAALFWSSFSCLHALHCGGIVHGDPRLPNLLRRRSGPIDVESNRIACACSEWAINEPVTPSSGLNHDASVCSLNGEFFWIDFAHARSLQEYDDHQLLFERDLLAFFRSITEHDSTPGSVNRHQDALFSLLPVHFAQYSKVLQDADACKGMAQSLLDAIQSGTKSR